MRILGITIPNNKHLAIGLTALYGIGRARALKILKEARVDHTLKGDAITLDQENAIRKIIETMSILKKQQII